MQRKILTLILLLLSTAASAKDYFARDFGILPNTTKDHSIAISVLLAQISKDKQANRLIFEQGTYNFHPQKVNQRTYYISNHDQVNPKNIGIAIEGHENLTIDGNGSQFLFHGRMLPISIIDGKNITLRGLSIDFPKPHIAQVEIIDNDTINAKITYRIAPWVDYEIRDGLFVNKGDGWENVIGGAIGFDGQTRRILYRTSDIDHGKKNIEIVNDSTIILEWKNPQLIKGSVLALRSWFRPAPGIFVDNTKNLLLENVTVHYAEGMGLMAQMSENITLDGFRVCLRDQNDPRYFTTQADATHFSGCKGKIISKNGFYEGMMDDAINIHGTYLKIVKRVDNHTVVGKYMHNQAFGFTWGYAGDEVQFVLSKTMEILGDKNNIESITPYDKAEVTGAREFLISFEKPLNEQIKENISIGIENLTWTPEVLFENNTICNNRARGTLFSTPKQTIIQNNTFDHTSGTAILLCGDCNGWFETGACKDVIIRNNIFKNSLTNMFQFTNAIISIYPEIPDLKAQKKYFHSSIKIYNNTFITFDRPIVYAKSVDGLEFYNNTIQTNNDYKPFHFIKTPFYFERVINFKIYDNKFDYKFNPKTDITNNI